MLHPAQSFALSLVQMMWGKNVFSYSDKLLHETQAFLGEINPHMSRSISPKNMMGLVESFDHNLADAIKSWSIPSKPVSLQDFVIPIAYQATGRAMFGPTFDADGTYDDFMGFDNMVWKVALGYPPSLLREFVAARERLIWKLVDYLDKPHEPSELMSGIEQICRAHNFDKRDFGAMLMGFFWPVMANVPWGAVVSRYGCPLLTPLTQLICRSGR